MYNRVHAYLERFNLLFINQYGFRQKHSTVDELVELTEKNGTEQSKHKHSFFLDLKKAFDTINHGILLLKLEKYGFRGKCSEWFKSYLSQRTQRVEANGVTSSWAKIDCGVPQDSILGPLLFIVYINDLPLSCKLTEVLLFADERQNFEQAAKTSKKQYYWNKFKSCIGDSRQTYKLLNELNGKNKTQLHKPSLQTCRENGGSPTDNDIAESLNH